MKSIITIRCLLLSLIALFNQIVGDKYINNYWTTLVYYNLKKYRGVN